MSIAAQNNQVFLFAGIDNFSAVEKANLWKEKFLEKYGEMNLILLDGQTLKGGEFRNAVLTAPFLSEKKLVLVRDFLAEADDDLRKEAIEVIDQIPEYAVLVFLENGEPDKRTSLFKKIDKDGEVQLFAPKKERELLEWIVARVAKKGGEIGRLEAQLILDLAGTDLGVLNKEIEKLLLYAGDRPIDRRMIEELVTVSLSSSVFKLTDELGAKHLQEVLRIFRILAESGEEVVGIFFMLVRHFRIMLQVSALQKKGMRASEIAKEIKEHPFVVSKIYSQVRNFSEADLRKIYQRLAEIDLGFKTGKIRLLTGDSSELERAIEVLFVQSCS